MVNGEVAPTERQLQSGDVLAMEHLSEPAPDTLDVAPVVDLSTTVGETTKSASSPQVLEVQNSSEAQESSEVPTASPMHDTPVIDPSTPGGDGGGASAVPGIGTAASENNKLRRDPPLCDRLEA